MEMGSSNNTIILRGCIDEFRKSNELSINDSDLFEIFATSMITKSYELAFEEIEEAIIDGGQDGGIDAYIILFNDKAISSEDDIEDLEISSSSNITLYIVQAKTEKTFTESTLDKLISSVPHLFNLELNEDALLIRFNEPLVERILLFRKIWITAIKKNAKILIEYIYACQSNDIQESPAFKSKTSQIIKMTEEKVSGAAVQYRSLSAKELLEQHHKTKISTLELNFKEPPISVTYRNDNIGYLGVASLDSYYSFITDKDGTLRENIFENNIRHYQGSVDVNELIKKTLENDYERDFWWLNNGITVIASKVGQFGKTLSLTEVQIVNGLQTSFTIGKFYRPGTDEPRSILIKVVITNDKEAVDQIISSTNRQNQVSAALLRATDERQRTIELYFFNRGFYYDRRKNYYKNQGRPSSKIFSIQYTAQAIQAIMNFDPASARSKPTSLIKEDKTYNSIFRTDVSFDIFLNCCLIIQKTKEYMKKNINPLSKLVGRNFTYHLARIATSLETQKAHYSYDDLQKVDINSFKTSLFDSALDTLVRSLSPYKEENKENIINISKSKKFSTEIDRVLNEAEKNGSLKA